MINMIASIGKNMELGKNNKLIWHIPEDMKFFKDTTMGHVVVMGWNTYKSLPAKLPGREMIVLSRNNNDDSVKIVRSIDDIVEEYKMISQEIYIIGGARIYSQFLPHADNLFLTEIAATYPMADSYFPIFDKKDWEDNSLFTGSYRDIDYEVHKYVRKRR